MKSNVIAIALSKIKRKPSGGGPLGISPSSDDEADEAPADEPSSVEVTAAQAVIDAVKVGNAEELAEALRSACRLATKSYGKGD